MQKTKTIVTTAVWALLAGTAQAQDCKPFVDLLSADRQSTVLSLNSCEVREAAGWGEYPQTQVWRLQPDALLRWKSALDGHALSADLAGAQLRAQPRYEGLAPGPLLNRISARLVKPAAWRWDAARGEIALSAEPGAAQACNPVGRRMLWPSTPDIAPGARTVARVLNALSASQIIPLPSGCVDAWRVEPAQYAQIDQAGVIRIAPDAPDATPVQVTAHIGAKQVRGDMRVSDPQRFPLVGIWSQVSETPCGTGIARTPVDKIRELKFDGSGNFSVTTTPFESYKDYWGSYTYEASDGAIRFNVVSGNKPPKSLQLVGRATYSAEQLDLQGLSLWQPKDGTAICGLRFALQRR